MRKNLMAGTMIAGALALLPAWGGADAAAPRPQTSACFGCLNNGELSITKTDGVTSVTAGQVVTYTIVVTLSSGDVVNDVAVVDTLPTSITGVTWTCLESGPAVCHLPSFGSGNLSAKADFLGVGGTVTYTVTGTLSASATGPLTNTATLTMPQGYIDNVPSTNTATDVDTVEPAPVETGEVGAGLPDNGSESQVMALVALAVLALGGGLVAGSRRLAAGRR